MRMIPATATFAFLAACGGTPDENAAGNLGMPANVAAPVNGIAAAPTGPSTRVGGPPDVYQPNEQKGGISRALTGEEGSSAAQQREDTINDLVGRWAYNCNTGVGTLVFHRDGRFTAPGGSGRFQVNVDNFQIVFTFDDGETETWVWSMRPGQLSLDPGPQAGSIARVLCSATP